MKEQIRRISAIRVLFERLWSLRSDEHMIYMIRVWELYSRQAKQKYQWIKTTNNIFIYFFLCFCLLIFLPINAQEPMGSFANVQNRSRIKPMRRILSFHGFHLLLDLLRISLRLTALDCLKRRENP